MRNDSVVLFHQCCSQRMPRRLPERTSCAAMQFGVGSAGSRILQCDRQRVEPYFLWDGRLQVLPGTRQAPNARDRGNEKIECVLGGWIGIALLRFYAGGSTVKPFMRHGRHSPHRYNKKRCLLLNVSEARRQRRLNLMVRCIAMLKIDRDNDENRPTSSSKDTRESNRDH